MIVALAFEFIVLDGAKKQTTSQFSHASSFLRKVVNFFNQDHRLAAMQGTRDNMKFRLLFDPAGNWVL